MENESGQSELSAKTETAVKLKAHIEASKAALELLNNEYQSICFDIMKLMDAMDIYSVKMHGFTFYTAETETVKTPKTLEDKAKLFEFLRDKGLYDEMVSINSQSLNSLYRALSAEALEKGHLEFLMPGVDAPTSFRQLKLKKS